MPVFFTSRRFEIVPVLVVLAALVMRLVVAAQTSLNPDEALIFFIAQASDWYARSLRFHHPPLFYFLLHYIQWISDSELALRLLPIIAGSLFPWVIWKWLARQGFAHAALVALLLLEFSPTLLSLGAQVRGYTLALLLSSLALLFLEAALETRSLPRLVLAMLCLYLGILTEFSVAFVAGALGVYAMLRLVQEHRPMSFSLVWVLSQLGAPGVYALLYKTSIATLVSDPGTVQHVTGYLRHSFPQPSANRLYFAVAGAAKQFSYALSSMAVGVVGVALFMAGMIFLWRKEDAMRYRILAVALLSAFVFALTAALLQVHPYGRSRHTVVLALFVITGLGFGCEWLFRLFPRNEIPTTIFLVTACYFAATPDWQNMPKDAQKLSGMLQAIEQLQSRVPPNAIIFTDRETMWMLCYYLAKPRGCMTIAPNREFKEVQIGSHRTFSSNRGLGSPEQSNADLRLLRLRRQLSPLQPIWVVDGGFEMLSAASWPSAELHSNTLLLMPVSLPH